MFFKKLSALSLLLGFMISLSGCQSMIQKVAGRGMMKFNETHVNPVMMASEDIDLLCSMGESMTPMMLAMGETTKPAVPMLMMASSGCAEAEAREQELRYIRAVRHGDSENAKDARIQQARALELFARRNMQGYLAVTSAFGEPGDNCPELSDSEEFAWLMGMIGGIQAVSGDMSSGALLGYPLGIINKAMKGIQCLDSKKYWGLPNAIEAMTQTSDFIEAPAGVDPYEELQKAVDYGNRNGVRMAQVLQLTMYVNQGKTEKAKEVIRDHVASLNKYPAGDEHRMLDRMATRQVMLVSDKMWTQATGHRTPRGKLGTFWDDPKPESQALDIDDLLGGML